MLNTMLSYIATAASSTTGAILYIIAIAAWTFIAFRVRRNKNLLQNLEKLPPKDRLKALNEEMGAVPAPGMTAEQWLKHRLHSYYYKAILIALVLVAALAGLAIYTAKFSPQTPNFRGFAESMRTGIQRTFVEANLGPPHEQTKQNGYTEVVYERSDAILHIIYGEDNEVIEYSIALKMNGSWHPKIPYLGGLRLAEKSFLEISESGVMKGMPSDANFGGTVGDSYGEFYYLSSMTSVTDELELIMTETVLYDAQDYYSDETERAQTGERPDPFLMPGATSHDRYFSAHFKLNEACEGG